VPGPSAVTAAVCAAGAPVGDFVFVGFLKRKTGKLKKQMLGAAASGTSVVFFESAARLAGTLEALAEVFPPDITRICVAREMTKVHEEFIRGTLADVARGISGRDLKGEVTVVLSPGAEAPVEDEEEKI
jgi:16S rRNA (cytidine1402-2'-O)-methyltransferase